MNGGSWLPGHLWRPNGPPDDGIGEGEGDIQWRIKTSVGPRHPGLLCALGDINPKYTREKLTYDMLKYISL